VSVAPRLYRVTVTKCFDCPGLVVRSSWSFCKNQNFKNPGDTEMIPDWCPLPLETEKESSR